MTDEHSAMDEPETLPDLEWLERRTGPGLFTHEIYRRLAEQPVHLTRDHLANRLLQEQQIGTLRFRGRRWRSRGDDEPAVDYTGLHSPGVTTKRFLETIPVDVLPGNPMQTEGQDVQISEELPVGWALLRRLLPHYRECLRLAGASRLSQHIDRHRRQFELLRPRGRWWPDEAGARVLRVDRRRLTPEFLQGLHQRRTDPVLLGYPMSVTRAGEDNVFIDPVAILPCAWQIDDTALLLWPTETAPKLNPDWIGKRRERRAIKTLSLWLKGLDDDGKLEQPGAESWSDVPDLVETLRAVAPVPSLGPLDPGQTRPRLDLGADGALQNVLGLFLVGQSPYNRGARRDLDELSDWHDDDFANTALVSIFSTEQEASSEPVPVIPPLPISESQYLAIRDGLTQPLTVISGPPGTGKSQVVIALMVSAAAAGRSVLFVSHRHQALDAVQNRLEELVGDLPILARAYAGSQDQSFRFEQAINLILGRHVGTRARDTLEDRKAPLSDLGQRLDELLDTVSDYEALGEDLARLNGELTRREVAADETTHAAHRSTTSALMQWIFQVLRFLHLMPPVQQTKSEKAIAALTIRELRVHLRRAERRHRRAQDAIQEAAANRGLPDLLEALCQEGKKLLPALVDALHACSEEDLRRLVDLRGNLGSAGNPENLRSLWQDNAELVLRHFPLWACSTLAVPGRIPLVPGLFDYLIIDEATTSDIASALPLFARARHAIVVGDRQQTGMISDLHPTREAELRRRAGLNHAELGRFTYSRISLFDLLWSSAAANRHMLRDHFRSHAEIASYCSETFYDGRLFVRTDNSGLRPPNGQRPGLHWTHVTGPIERAGNGCRSHAEAAALVEHLVALVGDGGYDGSVGVVTPFNRQKELLVHMIEQRLPHDVIDRVHLRVGTSHAFQGDDRDVMLVSLCYGRDMPRNGDWFLRNSRELMNVAISRARAVCQVFGDREAARASDIRHIARLAADTSAEGAPQGDPRALFESPWEERTYDALCAAGLTPLPQYRLGGRRLDLALLENDIRLDVEVDGDTYHRDPDGFRKVSDIWRDHVITSLGWSVRRFWVYELKENMEKCVELVLRDLGR